MISMKTVKNNRIQSRKNTDKLSSNKFQTRFIMSSQKPKTNNEEDKQSEEEMVSKRVRELIEAIKEDEKKYKEDKYREGH